MKPRSGLSGVLAMVMSVTAADAPFVATTFTEAKSFTAEAEGPACDRDGNVYAVSFARKATIGRIRPTEPVRSFSRCHRAHLPTASDSTRKA
jgi:hypothetical protein